MRDKIQNGKPRLKANQPHPPSFLDDPHVIGEEVWSNQVLTHTHKIMSLEWLCIVVGDQLAISPSG